MHYFNSYPKTILLLLQHSENHSISGISSCIIANHFKIGFCAFPITIPATYRVLN